MALARIYGYANPDDLMQSLTDIGQRLYVAPGADLVVARFASHPVAASAANDPITQPQLRALARLLADR